MKMLKQSRYLICLFLNLKLFFISSICFSETPLKIGLMAELTGSFSRLGEDCRRGYEVAQKVYAPLGKLGNKNIEFILGDNQGIAKSGLTEFKRLVDVEKVTVVVTTRSPVGLAINPISKKKKLPIIGIVGYPNFTKDNNYAFRAWPSAKSEGYTLADKSISLGKKKVAVVTLEDEYFLAISKAFKEKFTQGGGEVTISQSVLPSEIEFSSIISRIISKAPDLVLVNLAPVQVGNMIKKLRELGFTGQIISNFLMSLPDVLKTAGSAAEGVYFVEVDYNKKGFLNKLKSLFNSNQSSPIGYSCYLGLSTLLQAIRENSSKLDSEEVYKALINQKNVELIDGKLKINEREIQMELSIRKVQNGKIS